MQMVGCAIERFGPRDFAVVSIRFQKRAKAFGGVVFSGQCWRAALLRGIAEELFLSGVSLRAHFGQFDSPRLLARDPIDGCRIVKTKYTANVSERLKPYRRSATFECLIVADAAAFRQ